MNALKENLLANVVGTSSLALVQLVCVPIYIHFLGVEAYGLIGFFTALQVSLRMLDLGLSQTLNRELARLSALPGRADGMRSLVRTVEAGYWVVGIVAGALVSAASHWIATRWINAGTLPVAEVHHAVLLMGPIVAVQWPMSLYQGGLMGLQRQVLLNVIRVAGALLSGGGALLVLWLISRTLGAFFVWQMIVGLLQALCAALALWAILPKGERAARIQIAAIRETLPFARGMSGIAVAGMILTQMDKIILSRLLPLETFGYYALAALAASSLQLFISPVFGAFFPQLSGLATADNARSVSLVYHRGTQVMVVLVAPLAAIVALFAFDILRLWTGSANVASQAAPIVKFLVLGTAINGIMFMPYALQLAYGWTAVSLILTVSMVIVLVPAVYLMALHFGAVGAASVWLMLNVLNLLIAVPVTHRRLLRREAWPWIASDVALPALVAFAIVYGARELFTLPASRLGGVVQLGLLFAVTLLASALAATELRAWLARRLGRFGSRRVNNPMSSDLPLSRADSPVAEALARGGAPRIYLRVPTQRVRLSSPLRLAHGLRGLGLRPVYLVLAYVARAPGLRFGARSAAVALEQLMRRRRGLSLEELYKLLVYPLDSVRYFEFDFVGRALSGTAYGQYLDVSSPRMFPLLLIRDCPDLQARLLNPDVNDLPVTRRFAQVMGIAERCQFLGEQIEMAGIPDQSIDLLTCISVLEHIPADRSAVAKMWSLLRPGGTLVLTVPCAARSFEEYINENKYGLLRNDDDGFVFWQRYYDPRMLEQRIFAVTGQPAEQRVFGERRPGLYAGNIQDKLRLGPRYSFAREPYMMVRDYRYYDSVEQLPGMGIIGMAFRKGTAHHE